MRDEMDSDYQLPAHVASAWMRSHISVRIYQTVSHFYGVNVKLVQRVMKIQIQI